MGLRQPMRCAADFARRGLLIMDFCARLGDGNNGCRIPCHILDHVRNNRERCHRLEFGKVRRRKHGMAAQAAISALATKGLSKFMV